MMSTHKSLTSCLLAAGKMAVVRPNGPIVSNGLSRAGLGPSAASSRAQKAVAMAQQQGRDAIAKAAAQQRPANGRVLVANGGQALRPALAGNGAAGGVAGSSGGSTIVSVSQLISFLPGCLASLYVQACCCFKADVRALWR